MTYRDLLVQTEIKKTPSQPNWIWGLRQTAFERFKALGWPARSHEAWRYINLETVLGSAFLAGEASAAPEPENASSFFLEGEASRLVFVNGRFSASLSAASPGQGVVISDLPTALRDSEEALKSALGKSIASEENPFAAVNTFSFRDAAVIRVPDHATLDAPVHILYFQTEPAAVYPRVLILAGKCVRLKLIVDFVGNGSARFFSDAVTEAYLGEGACLDFYQTERPGAEGIQFSSHRFCLKEYASLNAYLFSRGGALTRNDASVDFQGEGGFASLKGFAVAKDRSQIFTHASARHGKPHCTSNQLYKAILAGEAKSEFNSLVEVPKGAQKSLSHQMNRNLLLSDRAQSFSRPQLRIDADDVQCVHGSATGQLEESELFYLRSRGLTERKARYLMTYGFAAEWLHQIQEKALKARLEKDVREELETVVK